MENPAKRFAGATQAAFPLDCVSQPREDQRLLRSTQRDLQLMMTPRVNVLVLVTGVDSAVQSALHQLRPALDEPISVWQPGEPLVLPPPTRGGTMIFHSVGDLTHEDQRRLLEWLQHAGRRTRLVSTTTAPLFPRVEAGSFIDALYYYLNTVYLDLTAQADIG